LPSSEAAGAARLLTALVAWAGAIAGGLLLTMVVAHSIHTATPSAAGTSRGGVSSIARGGPSGSSFDPASIAPASRRSLFVGPNFSRMLHIVRSHLTPRTEVESVRIAPGDAQFIVIRAGNEHIINVRTNGEYSDIANGPLNTSTEVFALPQIQANAPAALARRIARHGGVPVSGLNYMVIATNPVEHVFIWGVYAKHSDIHFQASSATSSIQKFTGSGSRTLHG
jgi:hypothetical protein